MKRCVACAICGVDVPENPRARARLTCGTNCRSILYRERRRERLAMQTICDHATMTPLTDRTFIHWCRACDRRLPSTFPLATCNRCGTENLLQRSACVACKARRAAEIEAAERAGRGNLVG